MAPSWRRRLTPASGDGHSVLWSTAGTPAGVLDGKAGSSPASSFVVVQSDMDAIGSRAALPDLFLLFDRSWFVTALWDDAFRLHRRVERRHPTRLLESRSPGFAA